MKLALNGINLGALMRAGEEPKEKTRDIGDSSEATDGTNRVTRLARKNDITFKSVPLTHDQAHAWKCLLTGEGEAWSFDTSLYGSKGTGPSSGTGTQSAGSAKYGAGKLSVPATTGTIVFAGVTVNGWGGSTAWTVLVWRFESGAFHHYVVRSDGAKWLDGVRADATATTWLTVSSGNVTIANATGSAVVYDDLVVLPFAVLDDWPAQVYAAAVAFGPLPFLLATGDMVKEQTARTVSGKVEEATYTVVAQGVRKTLNVELMAR